MSVISASNLPSIEPGAAAGPKQATSAGVQGPQATEQQRVKTLAAQFESLLVGQMMQQLRSSMFESEEGAGKNETAPLADALFNELSLALSRAGGIGLADSFMGPLMRETGAGGGASATPSTMAAAAGMVVPGSLDGAELPNMPETAAPFVSGRMSSAYGWRRDPIDDSVKFHKGVDIAMPVGNNVPAPQAGTVTAAGEVAGYGLTVVIDHGSFSTRYAHLSKIDVKPGDAVQAGQVIAQSGATGRVTGAHLHFEVLEAGQSVNPAAILPTYAAGGSQDRN